MKKRLLLLCLVTTMAHAENSVFSHKEWVVICDNTRTCRAVGFTRNDADSFASLLLTRQAGQGQQITADIKLADLFEGEEQHFSQTGALYIDDQYAGPLHFNDEDKARLTPHQTQSTIKAVKGKRPIRIQSGEYVSVILNDGGYAAMLNMDTVQGRLGTTSAVTRRGTNTEVLPALPTPVIERKPVYSLKVSKWNSVIDVAALKKEVVSEVRDGCDFSNSEVSEFEPTVVAQLTRDTLLVSATCVHSASNPNVGFWRINTQSPYQPEEILLDASGFDEEQGDIVADFLERGYGDCLSHRQWVWTGETFALASEYDTGKCELIHGSGAWELPTFVSVIK